MSVVVITGVTSGIGRALAVQFHKLGHIVVGCGRRDTLLKDLAGQCTGTPTTAFDIVDVTREGDVAAWAQEVFRRHEHVDYLINNAGVIHRPVPVWELTSEEFRRVMDTNVVGVHNTLRHFLPPMVASGKGVVVNISSGSGRSTGAVKGAYCASKFAVEALTKSVAASLPPGMVAVPLAPGTLQTELNNDPTRPKPETWAADAVQCILSLTPEQSGASLSVDGYYDDDYVATWIINQGQPLVPEPVR